MNIISKSVSVSCLIVTLLTNLVSAQSQEDVGQRVQELWSANNISQLNTYLIGLSSSSPNYAPAVVAGAFYDFIFLGKLNDAKAKLQRVLAVAQSDPQTFPAAFTVSLSAIISNVDDEIRIQSAHGESEQDWQANANAQEVKNVVGSTFFPIIEVIKSTPKVSLPTQ